MPYIDPHSVKPRETDPHFVRKVEAVLLKQGQIEPLQVKAIRGVNLDGTPTEETYVTFDEDVWGDEIVVAARNLGWDVILIHITDRYDK